MDRWQYLWAELTAGWAEHDLRRLLEADNLIGDDLFDVDESGVFVIKVCPMLFLGPRTEDEMWDYMEGRFKEPGMAEFVKWFFNEPNSLDLVLTEVRKCVLSFSTEVSGH